MESQRSFLLIGLAIVSYLLWQQWNIEFGPQPVQQQIIDSQTPQQNAVPSADLVAPTANNTDVPVAETTTPVATAAQSNQVITVTTDTLAVQISLIGGDVISADLLDFPLEQDKEEPFHLLRPTNGEYIAKSGLIGANGPDGNPNGRPLYKAGQTDYSLTGDTLAVPLIWVSADGITVTKTFRFTQGRHDIEVSYDIANQTAANIQVIPYGELKQTTNQPDTGSMFMATYRGAAYSTEEQLYEKYGFDDIEDENLRELTIGGWVAMLEHYFVSAWVPPQDQENTLFSRTTSGDMAYIGYKGQPVVVTPNANATIASILYLGPKHQSVLEELARGLDLTVDYGPLWMISQVLFDLLNLLHDWVKNWGVAIILITIIVKGLMYPLTKKQYESMAKLRNLAPKMQQLKERYGDDRQKMSQAMMELYRKEKANPMGGCLPLLLQMPIFLALYWALMESVELRHADFALWITDLSVKDPYYVLPILTGLTMYLLQKLQPMTVTDPMQQKMMQIMPVVMSIFFFWFPAGLVLYWLVSNIITLVQAKMIYASMEKRGIKTS